MRFLVGLLMAGLAAGGAAAGDVERGEIKAQVCVQCHGDLGNAPIANYPKLAGQNEKYLIYTMKAYKSGKRNNAVMALQAAALDDDDIADLAAYFAAQDGDLQ